MSLVGMPLISWNLCGRSEWGNDYETSKTAENASIIGNVTNDYPPIYISDGNTVSFYNQAIAFDKELTAMGHFHVFNFYGRDKPS